METDVRNDPEATAQPTRRRAFTRATISLPGPVADALIVRAERSFRRPRDEAVALIVESLRQSGDLSDVER